MKETSGFTVLEVILATAVAGFIFLGIGGMINTLNVVNDRARDLTLANALAENKVETLRSAGFGGLSDGVVDFTAELPDTLAPPRAATYSISSPESNLRQVDINITYSDRGQPRSLDYRTYIGELGIGQY